MEDNTVEGQIRQFKTKAADKHLDEVTQELLSKCTLNGSVIEYVDSEEDEVVEGQVAGGTVVDNLSMPETDAERQALEAAEAAAAACSCSCHRRASST